ncbi:hypothetical protein C8R45DRAFT_950051 [Mycena sanguinolenta]|nr:hypothetical protein C8R45DRAFT_950051 [Mycena sanguinolenta]
MYSSLPSEPPSSILMPFEALGEDILLSILCFCDVYTVMVVSATNKPLRRVTLAKQLWLSLIQDSAFRAALDLPPPDPEELGNHSTEELVDFVRSAVVGPDLLLNNRPSATTTYANYKIILDNMGDHPGTQLLSGARYILLQNTTREEVYLYDVWSARRLWQRPVQVDTICKVDLVPGGAIARVLLAQPLNYPNQQRLHIEEVDLISGISRQVFELGCPQYLVISSLAKYAIVGDFCLCTMLLSLVWHGKVILVNWRTSTFVDLGNGPNFALELIPQYVVWTDLQYDPSQQQILAVTTLDQFSNDWQPLSDARLAAQLESRDPTTPSMVRERLAYDNHSLGSRSVDVQLMVTPNALYRGAYNISVQAESCTYARSKAAAGSTRGSAVIQVHTSTVSRASMQIAARIRTACFAHNQNVFPESSCTVVRRLGHHFLSSAEVASNAGLVGGKR